MILWRTLNFLLALVAMTSSVMSGTITRTPKERWLVVANTKDIDTAIGIAGYYEGEPARVVASGKGFAVELGPYVAKTIPEVVRMRPEMPRLPRESALSNDATHGQTVWDRTQNKQRFLKDLKRAHTVTLKEGTLGVRIRVNKPMKNDVSGLMTVSGMIENKAVFSFVLGETDESPWGMSAGLLRLDPNSDYPQIVLTRYTGGAHCCTRTWIVTKPFKSSTWQLLDTGSLDGTGFGFHDLDGNGVLELASVDNEFLYAFDTYASSYAPSQYRALRGLELIDISDSSVANHALRQDLAAMEFQAKLEPENWRRHGFLAAWVAAKIRLGQGEEAWSTMLENFDVTTQSVQIECANGLDIELCPASMQQSVPFPQALAEFLTTTGYGPLPFAAKQ